MKMQSTYGIFDHEADHIIDMVRRHVLLAEIRRVACPACGSEIGVEFTDDGSAFMFHCHGKPSHISKFQTIDKPPPWWRECIVEPTETTFYWRKWHAFDNNGNLTMKLSGFNAEDCHWLGQMECPVTHPDYPFWKWVLLESDCAADLITDRELAKLRVRYAESDE